MAISTVKGVRIAGIASAVPSHVKTALQESLAISHKVDVDKIINSTGVKQRHVVAPSQCTSDLCFVAAQRLLADLNWEASSIDVLIFISQTPDYVLPPTSCVLQQQLNLSKDCACFDVNLGCSGFVYGLWMATNFIASKSAKRVLLLVGDTVSKIVSEEDSSVAFLFGDAGTATAVEVSADASPWFFKLGTDGKGYEHLIVPAGGFRQPRTENTAQLLGQVDGNKRSAEHLFMEGGEIFSFTIREIGKLVNEVLQIANQTVEQTDVFIMHQANLFMLKHLQKRLKIPDEKFIIGLRNFGNTSSASIPLAITTELREKILASSVKLVLTGFGVGFSWASVALTLDKNAVLPDLLFLSTTGAK